MKNILKVLHLASFTGNIGDEANHKGFKYQISKNTNFEFEYTNLEIRNFYKSWNVMRFDTEFVNICNEHDFVIIGGGNFLELCWDYSKTGTTIDISIDSLKKIKVPLLFNAIGVDDGKGINENNINKFRIFLDYILNNERVLFSVRNDGSKKILQRYFITSNLDRVYTVPDGGFFINSEDFNHIEVCKENINIGINIAGDMKEIRFNDYLSFCKDFGNYINYILNYDDRINVTFIPHMYADIQIISQVLEYINDIHRRTRIGVAPLLNSKLKGGDYIFSLYKKMDLVLGMRFHANVCSIGQNIPNIGLISYHKHGYLFDEIGLSDRALYIKNNNFFKDLLIKTKTDLRNLEEIKMRYSFVNQELNSEIKMFHQLIEDFLLNNL